MHLFKLKQHAIKFFINERLTKIHTDCRRFCSRQAITAATREISSMKSRIKMIFLFILDFCTSSGYFLYQEPAFLASQETELNENILCWQDFHLICHMELCVFVGAELYYRRTLYLSVIAEAVTASELGKRFLPVFA